MKTPPRKEIAGYLLTDFLGAGNSASVFKAIKDEQNIAAVKIRLVGNSNYENLLYQRFFEGARLQYFCNHPNIAFLHQYIEDQEMQAILIEYLPGGSLSNRIKKFGPLSFEDLIKLGIYLADALNHLEDLSIIHRDIKTDNLLFADIKKIESINHVMYWLKQIPRIKSVHCVGCSRPPVPCFELKKKVVDVGSRRRRCSGVQRHSSSTRYPRRICSYWQAPVFQRQHGARA